MSSSSSLDLEENLDVGECPDVKTVQSSYLESIKKQDLPIPQVSPSFHPSQEPDSSHLNPADHSFSGLSSISSTSKASEKKNFIQKNIEKTKKKDQKVDPGILNIEELGLEEEFETKKVPIDVDERFYKYQNKVQEKIQSIAKDLKEKEKKVCTFQPDIKTQRQRRTNDEFFEQMKNFEKRKKEKIESMRSQKEIALEEETHKPTINPRSKELLAKRQENKPVFEKLYQQAKNTEKDRSSPKVEKKSLKKTEFDNHLYEDALRRAAKQPEIKNPVKEVQTSLNSHLVLAKKFMKEFQEVFTALNGETETISLETATKGLVCLNFIRNNPEHPKYEEEKFLVEKLFSLIEAKDSVKIINLLKICLAMINIYIPSMTTSQDCPRSALGVMVEGNYSIFKEEVQKVHKFFNLFYENRQLSNQVIKEISAETFSFRPQLNPTTETYAKQVQKRSGSLYSIKRENFLQEEKKKAQEKIEKIKRDREEEEKKNCTFKPTLISKSVSKQELPEKDRRKALYEKSKEINEKKKSQAKATDEQGLEKDMAECTFAPKLERIKVKEEKDILYSKSVQQQLIRMQKGREEQERKKNLLERLPNKNFKSSVRSPTFDSKSRTQEKIRFFDGLSDVSPILTAPFQPPFEIPPQESHSEDEEIQLEVKLPNGKVKTLVIPPGSDKELKLSMFIIENRLTEEMGLKLRESLLNI